MIGMLEPHKYEMRLLELACIIWSNDGVERLQDLYAHGLIIPSAQNAAQSRHCPCLYGLLPAIYLRFTSEDMAWLHALQQ
jgi:hypothetical protein